jgi:imidazolonepropionase-like amidohydrolase
VYDIYNDDFILGEGAKVGMLPESIEKERALGKLQRAGFQRAYQAGCKLAFGTDGGVYPHGDNWKQFHTMVELGMKPIDAIRTATLNAAELLGLSKEAGSLEAGFLADVIAVDGDPLQDVLRLGSVKFVMRQGVVYRKD